MYKRDEQILVSGSTEICLFTKIITLFTFSVYQYLNKVQKKRLTNRILIFF